MLSKIIVFYGNKITFGGSWDTHMFIICIISPTTIDKSVTEKNYAKKSSFTENIIDDFFPGLVPFFTVFTPLKQNGGPG